MIHFRRSSFKTPPARGAGSASGPRADGLGARAPALTVLAAALAAALATGCATGPLPPQELPTIAAPPQWLRTVDPLPHEGSRAELVRWWQQFDDPVVAELVAQAQAVSPTLGAAAARIELARANRTVANAAGLPAVDAGAAATRGRNDLLTPTGTSLSAGLQAGWEIDLFGGIRAGSLAADARLQATEADWHEARVSVAAETANTYLQLRACEAQLAIIEQDATSRAETFRLTELTAQAGLAAPATASLSRASAAQGRALALQQRAQCEQISLALASLTGQDAAALRQRLAGATARLPVPARLDVQSVPAEALAQRPDLYAAAREVLATAYDTAQADAQLKPRVTLSGNVNAVRLQSGDLSLSGTTWAIGPLAVSLPVFDGGSRAAQVDAARARYDAAISAYQASLREAVREVEDSLSQLASTAARQEDSADAVRGFEESLLATDARFRGGLGSLFELEDARRSLLLARRTYTDLQRERVAAWINLYRALGGGWTPDSPAPAAALARAASAGSAGPVAFVAPAAPATALRP